MSRPRAIACIVAALFLLGAVHEGARVVANLPWAGFAPLASHTISITLATLWTLGAVTLLLQRPAWGWFVAGIGALAFLAHGAVVSTGGQVLGVAYVAAALIAIPGVAASVRCFYPLAPPLATQERRDESTEPTLPLERIPGWGSASTTREPSWWHPAHRTRPSAPREGPGGRVSH